MPQSAEIYRTLGPPAGGRSEHPRREGAGVKTPRTGRDLPDLTGDGQLAPEFDDIDRDSPPVSGAIGLRQLPQLPTPNSQLPTPNSSQLPTPNCQLPTSKPQTAKPCELRNPASCHASSQVATRRRESTFRSALEVGSGRLGVPHAGRPPSYCSDAVTSCTPSGVSTEPDRTAARTS